MELTGHSSIGVVLDHYRKVSQAELMGAVEQLDSRGGQTHEEEPPEGEATSQETEDHRSAEELNDASEGR